MSRIRIVVTGRSPGWVKAPGRVGGIGMGMRQGAVLLSLVLFAGLPPFVPGITKGCAAEPLRSHPDRPATRTHMAAFLSRAKARR